MDDTTRKLSGHLEKPSRGGRSNTSSKCAHMKEEAAQEPGNTTLVTKEPADSEPAQPSSLSQADLIKKVAEDLMALPDEEYFARLEKTKEKMRLARKSGEFNWGNAVWYGKNPEEYLEQCKKEGVDV